MRLVSFEDFWVRSSGRCDRGTSLPLCQCTLVHRAQCRAMMEITASEKRPACPKLLECEPESKSLKTGNPGKPKLTRKGGIEFRNNSFNLPCGPQTLTQLMDWPKFIVSQVIADPGRKTRLFDVMNRGMTVHTAYSGLDAPREVLSQVTNELQRSFNLWTQVDFIHACDNASGPQAVWVSLAKQLDLSCSCVFSDIEDRLPLETVAELNALNPEKDMSYEAKAAAYKQMWQHLDDNRKTVFNPFATSQCLVHMRQCRIVGDRVSFDPDSQDTQEMSPGLAGHRPLKVHFAGTVCKGWSCAGSRAQFSHESERTHSVWLAERKARAEQGLEDICFQECTPAYAVQEKLKVPLEDTHSVHALKTCPQLQGWPTSRPRSYTVLLNNKRWGVRGNGLIMLDLCQSFQ